MTAVIEVADLKAHLNITFDTDDVLLADKIATAQCAVENYIGEALDVNAPAPLKEAVRQLASHYYVNRDGADAMPLGVFDLVGPYRCWLL